MKRGLIIGIAAGAAVLVAAGATVWALTRPESAEDAASRYVTALQEGDVDAVAAFLPDDDAQLLELFAGATDHISDAKLSAPADDGSFRADVTIDGGPGVLFFMLSDASGAWQLSGDYLASLDITTTIGDSVDIGETAVPVGTVSLLPAVYTVRAAPAAVLSGETAVAVTNDQPLTVTLEASLSPDATALAQQQLDAYAAACAEPATAVPAHCGLRVPWGADLSALESLDFRVEKTPQVVLAEDAASFAATGGVIVASARGTARSGGGTEFTYRADDWSLYGSVSFEGDQMVLAVR